MLNKRILQTAITVASLSLAGSAMAATSVSWLTPPDGTHFLAGTTQTVTGQAAGQGQTGGTGLDLVLVMDASGSMGGTGITSQRAAANAIIDALPQATTSVGLVSFTNGAITRQGLTALDGTNGTLHTTVNGINAGGGTAIHNGINQANLVLGSSVAVTTRLQAMIVMSDGGSSISAADNAADSAMASHTEAIHSVGMGRFFSAAALKAAVNGTDNTYGNADDYGSFVGANFASLIGLFSGTTGNLVGLDHVDITLPDGTVMTNYATDGFGNFTLNYTLALGANVFSALAVGADGSSATASWTLYGDAGSNEVPEPATVLLFGVGLAGLIAQSRKKMVK